MYRMISAENSVFSGKTRAYLRFKQSQGDLGPGFEDILVTPPRQLKTGDVSRP